MLTDPKESIDKLEDLATDEWESLREWEVNYRNMIITATKKLIYISL